LSTPPYTLHVPPMSSCKVPIIFVRLKQNLHFLDRFSKKVSNIKFVQILSSGSRVVLCESRLLASSCQSVSQSGCLTDMTKLIVGFRNFARA
jgi:hypothetical protein